MPRKAVEVDWEVATDERMRQVVQKGTAIAAPELGHAVHVEVNGLEPGRDYFYQFIGGDEASQVGRLKTRRGRCSGRSHQLRRVRLPAL